MYYASKNNNNKKQKFDINLSPVGRITKQKQ
jgi:hypothetical protein